jgi:putative transposase
VRVARPVRKAGRRNPAGESRPGRCGPTLTRKPLHARRWCEDYFTWYNHQHHHSGLGFYTPTQVFTGQYRAIAHVRQAALDAHYHQHPERFVHGPPKAALPPAQVFINPVEPEDADHPEAHLVNFPTLPAAREALQRYL